MNAPAAFRATYSDWKLIRSRKVVQIVLELPLEASGQAYDTLGGMPNPGAEIWVGVARLKNESEVMPPAQHEPPTDARPAPDNPVASVSARAKRQWRDKSYGEQAAILGSEAGFRRFLLEQAGIVGRTGVCEAITEDKAAEMVKAHCLVSSRADIRDNHPSGPLWRELVERYRVWEAAPACGVA